MCLSGTTTGLLDGSDDLLPSVQSCPCRAAVVCLAGDKLYTLRHAWTADCAVSIIARKDLHMPFHMPSSYPACIEPKLGP